jgi:hypothetical protein
MNGALTPIAVEILFIFLFKNEKIETESGKMDH